MRRMYGRVRVGMCERGRGGEGKRGTSTPLGLIDGIIDGMSDSSTSSIEEATTCRSSTRRMRSSQALVDCAEGSSEAEERVIEDLSAGDGKGEEEEEERALALLS